MTLNPIDRKRIEREAEMDAILSALWDIRVEWPSGLVTMEAGPELAERIRVVLGVRE